jgi:hypothetical protein
MFPVTLPTTSPRLTSDIPNQPASLHHKKLSNHTPTQGTIMDSFEIAKQMKLLSIDSSHSAPPPPESLLSPLPFFAFKLDASGFDDMSSSPFELDCSRFDSLSPSPSLASSSYNSLSSQYTQASSFSTSKNNFGGRLTRNTCVRNLSALCSDSSVDVGMSSMESLISPYQSGINVGWGYFVETPSR